MLEIGKADLIDLQFEKVSDQYPAFIVRIAGVPQAHLTIATYGYNFELARAAALKLAYDYEIFSEILLFSQLSPFEIDLLLGSVKRTRHLLTVEEGTQTLGWGAEIAARTAEAISNFKYARAAALDLPIANSKTLEDMILPSTEKIIQMARDLVK